MSMSLKDKVVLVTGASSGIGEATAVQFAALGAKLILTARRIERIEKLSEQLRENHGVEVLPLQLDVRDRSAVEKAITTLPKAWCNIAVLVNNAGLALSTDTLQEANPENWDVMIDTNIKGLLYVTHAVLPRMLEAGEGHVVNISSIAGHEHYPAGNVYSATKHAVRALSKSLRLDTLGTGIRVSDVAPGAVHTEFSEVRWGDKEKSENFYAAFSALQADDIADAVVYCATRSPHVNVAEMVVMPTCQASCNHIFKGEPAEASFN